MKLKIVLILSSIFYIHSLLGSDNGLKSKNLSDLLKKDTLKDYPDLNGTTEHDFTSGISATKHRSDLFRLLIDKSEFLDALVVCKFMEKSDEYKEQLHYLDVKKTELLIVSKTDTVAHRYLSELDEVIKLFKEKSSDQKKTAGCYYNYYCAIQ